VFVSEVGRWGWWEYFIREEVENEWEREKKGGQERKDKEVIWDGSCWVRRVLMVLVKFGDGLMFSI